MTWLINVDNGGTTTGFCLVDGGEALSRELTARVNDLSVFGAGRLVIAVSGSDSADGEAQAKGCTPVICSARSRCRSAGKWSPTPYDIRAPGRASAFVHPASERFLFNADRRLLDARARKPSRIFRRRLTACSPRRGRACREAVMKQVRSLARPSRPGPAELLT
jgi:hypothetical protein